MAQFKGDTVISRDIKDVFVFLSDLRNHRRLMPEQVTNWVADENSASFTVNGMFDLSIALVEVKPYSLLVAEPSGKAPVRLKMMWQLLQEADGKTKATYIIDADLNIMLRAVASGPLKQLVKYSLERLRSIEREL